ncbi:MAG TPA: GNAT family N-acetyltransferase [Bellilinea sp.]|nr:GNAT family N-acetyltransferase [Bellilinea sp.]
MYTIRRATQYDARAIHALIRLVRINPMALDWRRFLVAVDEQDRVISCGQVKPHTDGTRELASLAVVPELQRQGIGRSIVEQLLAEYPLPLYLTCRASLQTYYEKFGFQVMHPTDMPPYFHRIWSIINAVGRVFRFDEALLVMVRKQS